MGPVARAEATPGEMSGEMAAAEMVAAEMAVAMAAMALRGKALLEGKREMAVIGVAMVEVKKVGREVATVVVAMAEVREEAWVAMAAMVGRVGRRSGKLRCCRRTAHCIGLGSGSNFHDKCTTTSSGSNNSSCDGGDANKHERNEMGKDHGDVMSCCA